jgi:hypothetical protein
MKMIILFIVLLTTEVVFANCEVYYPKDFSLGSPKWRATIEDANKCKFSTELCFSNSINEKICSFLKNNEQGSFDSSYYNKQGVRFYIQIDSIMFAFRSNTKIQNIHTGKMISDFPNWFLCSLYVVMPDKRYLHLFPNNLSCDAPVPRPLSGNEKSVKDIP